MRTPIAALAALLSFASAFGAAVTWESIPPEDLALTTPVVEADAGVEVLFRETSVNEDRREAFQTKTHVRYKVFDQRGVNALQKIDIRYDSNQSHMTAIGARVIKPDGTIVEVERKSFFIREVVRNRYYRYKAISFSPPALEPGVVVEYKLSLVGDPAYIGLFALQDEFPTRLVRFRVQAPDVEFLKMLTLYHLCPHQQPRLENGYYVVSQEMVPGAKDEPYAPPDEVVRSWMIYRYTYDMQEVENFWGVLGRRLFRDNEKPLKMRPEIRKACATVIAGAATELEKLERIDTFCRTQIRNLGSDVSGYTPEEIGKLKPNKVPADTLANKYGTGSDLRLLFIALARAAGFDARLARCSDRNGRAFDKTMVVDLTVPDTIVAVNVAGVWWFTQPNIPYVPFGALHWTNEGETALVADATSPPFAKTQLSPASQSKRQRSATLTLADDGTLEGDVTIKLTGHPAMSKKDELDHETPARREEIVREEVTERLPAAEVSAIALDDLTAPLGALTIRYHLKLPGYAQITGQRLFVQLSIFEVGSAAVFTAEDRKYPIFFPYQFTELDHMEIKLPEGYALEIAESPEALKPNAALTYEPKISFRLSDRTLFYDRTYIQNLRNVDSAKYGLLRDLFGHIHRQDAHSVGIRREEAPAAGATEAPTT